MADWHDKLDILTGLTVAGITLLDIDEIPDVLPSTDLPLMFPVFDDDRYPSSVSVPTGYQEERILSVFEVNHTCFVYPIGQAGGTKQAYPQTIDLMDAYLLELASNFIDSGIFVEARLRVGRFRWGQYSYFGFSARVKMKLIILGV